MRRAILGAALVPVAVVAAGAGFGFKLRRYFANAPDVCERIADETNAHIDEMIARAEALEAAGISLDLPGDSQ